MSQARPSILVAVTRPRDVELTQALLEALGDRFTYVLLFASQGLRSRFGITEHEGCCDILAPVLSAGAFDMFLSFAGPQVASTPSELLLCHLFNELRVPTVTIQSSLLQPGCPPLLGAPDRVASVLAQGYAAKTLLCWGGQDGIGYLRSAPASSPSILVRKDVTSITSGLDWDGYGEKELYQFAIAVTKLALAHPDETFVWRPRAEELADARGASVLQMVAEYGLENLIVEEKESLDSVLHRSRAGIAMLSTALLDLSRLHKPTLLFSSPSTDGLLDSSRAARFANYFEVEQAWTLLREQPALCRHEISIPTFAPSRLLDRLGAALETRAVPEDWMPTALKYLAYLREGETMRPKLEELSAELGQIGRRLSKLEKSASTVERTVKKLPDRLSRVLERIGVLQRSTLAYKARRLLTGQVSGALRAKRPK